MPWPRNDPDPFEERRRKLAQQERELADQVARLKARLDPSAEAPQPNVKPPEPPIWRLEEEIRPAEVAPTRKRHLARQRQRDMMLFFIAFGVLLVVVGIVVWIAYAHDATPGAGP